jgi:uncharacterized protein
VCCSVPGLAGGTRFGTVHCSGLVLYPIKSCAGVTVPEWPLDHAGLRHDRSFMVVDGTGRYLTQRECPQLALVRPAVIEEGWLVEVADVGAFTLPVRIDDGPRTTVTVWEHTGPAFDAGDPAAQALSALLGFPVRVVGLAPDHDRAADAGYGGDDVPVGFADGFPVLLTTEASLADLNRRMARPLPMSRFRPNLVVAGSATWDEDEWSQVRVGDCLIELVKPCSRCAITTVDPERGVRDGAEPLRTLGTFRRGDRGVLFGWNVLVRGPGVVRVGDPIAVDEI